MLNKTVTFAKAFLLQDFRRGYSIVLSMLIPLLYATGMRLYNTGAGTRYAPVLILYTIALNALLGVTWDFGYYLDSALLRSLRIIPHACGSFLTGILVVKFLATLSGLLGMLLILGTLTLPGALLFSFTSCIVFILMSSIGMLLLLITGRGASAAPLASVVFLFLWSWELLLPEKLSCLALLSPVAWAGRVFHLVLACTNGAGSAYQSGMFQDPGLALALLFYLAFGFITGFLLFRIRIY